MDLHELSPYYYLFNQLIEKNIYIEVEVLVDVDDKESVSDSVLIKDVYYGNGNLLVKYFSKNFQIILVVPHFYFKTILSISISEFLNKDTFSKLLSIQNKKKSIKDEALYPSESRFSEMTNLEYSFKNQHSSQYFSEVNTGVEGKFIFTISTLTNRLKQMIVKNFYSIWVKGEVDDSKLSANGHLFFNLRDENSSLSCVIYFRQLNKLKFKIENGIIFECFGNLTLYEKRGIYQLVVERLTPEGQGDFNLAFKQLQSKLEKEGLFSQDYKKPIPRYPQKIGIITSAKGAALYDFLKTTQNEFSNLSMVIFPCLVQGERASESITKMIGYANLLNQEQKLDIDVLVITRGGGSSEDLWPFNEEITARAIFNSNIPIISAIGHEVDWTIADLVADYRSATPTAAARFICEGMKNLEQEVFLLTQSLRKNMRLYLEGIKYKIKAFSLTRFYSLINSMIEFKGKDVIDLNRRLFFMIQQILSEKSHWMSIINVRLDTLSPQKVFNRGYMIVKKNNRLVSNLSSLSSGDKVEISSYSDSRQAEII